MTRRFSPIRLVTSEPPPPPSRSDTATETTTIETTTTDTIATGGPAEGGANDGAGPDLELDVRTDPSARAPLPTLLRPPRSLRTFTGAGYSKGRSRTWQVLWFAVMNMAFMKWWMPMRCRPAILRAFGAQVGERVRIRQSVRVLWPWKLSIGDDCWIGEGVWLLNLEPITIEHDACLSQEAFLCTGSHQHRDPAFEFDNAPIHIGAGAWIAARATVLRGTTVAPGVLVGSGSVVRPIPKQSRTGETR